MPRRLEVGAGAPASLVPQAVKKQWIGLAMDAQSRQGIALHVGDRRRRSAKRPWAKMPEAYWHHATFDADRYVVDAGG